MGLGSTISRGLSVAGSSNYEPSHRSGSSSTKSTMLLPSGASKTFKSSVVRASTITSATTTSQFMRTASQGHGSTSASMSLTLRPPSVTSKYSRASTSRNSIMTVATSTSNLVRSASTASTLHPQTSAPSTSTINLHHLASKRAPSYFSTAASRFLWGRPPPSHSTLQPSHVSALTYTLSLPADTPMLSSVVGALGPPSRSQFSAPPSCFCDAHFWFEQRYIEELTEVLAYEIGPQLEKLRMAPKTLISKKTERLLSILHPYKDIFAGITDTSSVVSDMKPNCPACTLSHFFQNPEAVNALTICVKGRKHRSRPWPASMAWLEPCPGKGVDWDGRWKTEGKHVARDRVRVQAWRRANCRPEETPPESPPQVPGHGPGEGCDFCDAWRMEQADDAELDAAIADEEERRAARGGTREETTDDDDDDDDDEFESDSIRYSDSETIRVHDDDSDDGSETIRDSDSETLRAIEEEAIVADYLTSPTTTTTTTTTTMANASLRHPFAKEEEGTRKKSIPHRMGEEEDANESKERAKRASDWARSYRHLVGKAPESRTTLQLERYPEPEVRAVEGWI